MVAADEDRIGSLCAQALTAACSAPALVQGILEAVMAPVSGPVDALREQLRQRDEQLQQLQLQVQQLQEDQRFREIHSQRVDPSAAQEQGAEGSKRCTAQPLSLGEPRQRDEQLLELQLQVQQLQKEQRRPLGAYATLPPSAAQEQGAEGVNRCTAQLLSLGTPSSSNRSAEVWTSKGKGTTEADLRGFRTHIVDRLTFLEEVVIDGRHSTELYQEATVAMKSAAKALAVLDKDPSHCEEITRDYVMQADPEQLIQNFNDQFEILEKIFLRSHEPDSDDDD